ncbi:hypothetical protein BE20_08175 [Sorangium cellulosum]|nr:hypothetical protein BE20_08175 [Sorangium cellulosum]
MPDAALLPVVPADAGPSIDAEVANTDRAASSAAVETLLAVFAILARRGPRAAACTPPILIILHGRRLS